VFISEDVFEYIMGVLEKHAEEKVPMLHTASRAVRAKWTPADPQDISTLPTFQYIEHLFASPLDPAFFPSFEFPRNMPSSKDLVRMAQRIYTHWKDRRTERKGKTIMPTLNYDETNDGDPYVCFRRRDIRATRKTRRTDNFSIERMQKLQVEMRNAHLLCTMILRRETEKAQQVKAEKEVWEAKWKLYETKRRWPSLGVSKEEEELITGKQSRESAMAQAGVVNASMLGGPLSAQRDNVPSAMRKKASDKDREEAEKRRDSRAMEAARTVERGMGMGAGARSNAPEQLKERMMALQQRLSGLIAMRREADAGFDDVTSVSWNGCLHKVRC
jgi:enhancer of polycomb-like protein